jgi:tetratricopeptide (TPR) repeat protein
MASLQANMIHEDKGIVFVLVILQRDGTVQAGSPTLEISSGYQKLDDAALTAVKAAGRFDPFPEQFKEEMLKCRLTFRYAYLPDAPFKDLYESARHEGSVQNYTGAAQLMEALLAKDPDFTNGWNYLGWIYNKLGRYDNGIAALKKAIAVNPRDFYAYNNLGQSYAYQKKYDQAIPQYLKQLEINPNDVYANANLGRAHLALGQYDKAVQALQAAVVASPKDPSVFYNLGRAYAKIGQTDRAEDAFKKSVELEPVPMRWNNVAYQMALVPLDLPKARHYAESGIAALVLKMRDTSLEHVGPEDAQMTTWMGNLWDTLGWILLEQGQTTEAEKYIRSSWLLRSHGEVGYHLGRVYETEGRKDDAIRLYELSLATGEPNSEARDHLARLLGTEGGIDQRVEERKPLLTEVRTISIPNPTKVDGVAEFWILLSPGPTVHGVKFISGDEVLRPFEKELESAKYPDVFPEATEIRLLRRGRLVCTGDQKPCRLLFASAETVRTDD